MKLIVQFDNPGNFEVEFPDEEVTMSLPVSRVSSQTFRIEAVPFLTESVQFRDVVRAEQTAPNALRVLEVVERANWKTFELILPKNLADSSQIATLRQRVETQGGYWEQVFGGCLFICMPPQSQFDPFVELNSIG